MNRRQFLFGSAMLVIGCKDVVWAGSKRPASALPIVDTHQHLWNLSQFRLPWLKAGRELTRDFTMADYKKATEGLGVTKAIYMEVAVAPEQKLAEAESAISTQFEKAFPELHRPVVYRCGDPRGPDHLAELGHALYTA